MIDEQVDETENTVAPEQTGKLSEKSKEPDRELARMKRALKAQQAERAQALAELDALKKEIEESKLSAQERERKEFEKIRQQAEEAQRRLAEREAEMEKLRLVNRLVGKHKLLDEDYADVVLKKYDPKEHEDFDEFVSELAKEDKFKRLFANVEPEQAPVPKAPSTPGSGTNRNANAKSGVTESIEAEAMGMFPNDAVRREVYVRTLKQIKGIS